MAVKADKGKLRLDLIPPEALAGAAAAFGYGAEKYKAWSWRGNGAAQWSRVYASIQRHLTAWYAGQDDDPESGQHHLHHALAQLMMLVTYHAASEGADDRYARESRHES
jgi:hypothetical protein